MFLVLTLVSRLHLSLALPSLDVPSSSSSLLHHAVLLCSESPSLCRQPMPPAVFRSNGAQTALVGWDGSLMQPPGAPTSDVLRGSDEPR